MSAHQYIGPQLSSILVVPLWSKRHYQRPPLPPVFFSLLSDQETSKGIHFCVTLVYIDDIYFCEQREQKVNVSGDICSVNFERNKKYIKST